MKTFIIFVENVYFMKMLYVNHHQLLKGINCTFKRYLYDQINWKNHLIGIFGPLGVGKTTMLLQRIKIEFGDSERALYLNLDDLWFDRESLSDTVEAFHKARGTHLFLDNVHRRLDWTSEIRKIRELYPRLHIVFAASSLESVELVKKSLPHELLCYSLHTMSFREFLSYESILDLPPLSFEDIQTNHHELVRKINSEINIVPVFRNYLEHGCYPFYWEDPDAYLFRLQDTITETIQVDLPAITHLSQSNTNKIRRLLMTIIEGVPDRPAASVLSKETGLLRTQIPDYVNYLRKAGCIAMPEYIANIPFKNQRIFPANTNLLLSLSCEKDERQNMAETFFIDQLSYASDLLEYLGNNDILINGKYTFVVGDPLKDYERIKNTENTYAAIHGLPKSIFNRMPIWLLGFCY